MKNRWATVDWHLKLLWLSSKNKMFILKISRDFLVFIRDRTVRMLFIWLEKMFLVNSILFLMILCWSPKNFQRKNLSKLPTNFPIFDFQEVEEYGRQIKIVVRKLTGKCHISISIFFAIIFFKFVNKCKYKYLGICQKFRYFLAEQNFFLILSFIKHSLSIVVQASKFFV